MYAFVFVQGKGPKKSINLTRTNTDKKTSEEDDSWYNYFFG